MAEPGHERSWWTTLPGVLTGVAALLTAVGGLVVALHPILRGPTPSTPIAAPVLPVSPRPLAVAPPAMPATPIAPADGQSRGGAPPLRLGETLDVGGSTVQVLSIEGSSLANGLREVRVTFQITAGLRDLVISRGAVRILDMGRAHAPVEGMATTPVPSGRQRQFWVRFAIEGPLREPVLSFRDDEFRPSGEARRALPDP
jgi:hypothetical protein